MKTRTSNRQIVGIGVVMVGLVIWYYAGVFRPDARIINNSERLLQEGESLLTKSGNIAVARKDLAWVEEGLPILEPWYTFPTHKTRGKKLADAKESLKERIDRREALQKGATATVDDLLAKKEFETANRELHGAMLKTGAEDEVMKALLSRIQDSYSDHVAKEVRTKVEAGDYQGAKDNLEAATKTPLGVKCDSTALLSVIQEAYSNHVAKEVRTKVEAGDYQGAKDNLEAATKTPLGAKCDSAALLSVIQDAYSAHVAKEVRAKVEAGDYQGAKDALEAATKTPLGAKCDSAALLSVIQDAYYVRVAREVNSQVKAGEYQLAKEKIETAAASSLGKECDFASLSNVVERVRVQDFKAAENELLFNARLTHGNSELHKEIGEILRLGKEANITKQALIAEKVEDLIKTASTTIWGFPQLKGKVMVWDYTKKTVEQAYEMLRDDLRASPHDDEFTIFGIRKRWDKTIGHYSISNQPALREYMEIGVVYWPSMTCAGYAVIEGGSPPAVRTVQYVPGRGSSVNIKNWIEGNASK